MAEAHLVHARQGALITYLLILKCNQSLECNAIMRRHYLQNVILYDTQLMDFFFIVSFYAGVYWSWHEAYG